MKKLLVLAILIAVCVAAVCLSIRRRANWGGTDGIVVCATTYPIWLFAREAARGTSIVPEILIPPSAGCPHDYVVSPADLAKISSGRILLLANGAGLDESAVRAAKAAGGDVRVIDASVGLTPVEGSCERCDGAEGTAHVHSVNGHFFASPEKARTIVRNIVEALIPCAATPEEAERIRRNGEEQDASLAALAKSFREELAFAKDVATAAQHNVFDCLFLDSGLRPPLSLAANPETPLSPAQLAELKRVFEEKNVRAIFTEPQYPEKIANLLASESGVTRVRKLDPCASGPDDPPAGFYEDVMKANLETLKEALR